ncbi:hypothetical protein LIER_24405 [Lithospermum erythrorhizon]|uniref:AN1-type domain-containing protein n=1 Tax=Lithospermum erythrorhizon TaxID=34254 RepID=A0AAV3R125_LITER
MDSCNHLQEVNKTISDKRQLQGSKSTVISNKGEKYNKNTFPCFNKSNNKDDSLTRNEDAADDEKTNGKVMCTYCDKKIRGLMIYKCRCNGRFCIKHRCPEEHSCKFDFKNHGRPALAKQNPVVKGEKLDQRI